MKKLLIVSLAIIAILAFNSVQAEETNPMPIPPTGWHMMKPGITNMHMDLKEMRMEKNQTIRENRQHIKENIMNFREEHGKPKDVFSQIDDAQKEELKALKNQFEADMKALREKYADMEKNEENYRAYREEVEALREAHLDAVHEIVWNDDEVAGYVEARKAVFEENKQIRDENMEARIAFRGERGEVIEQYKDSFGKRLGGKLWKVKEWNLSKVLDKITSVYEKIDGNTKLSDEKKDKILSQLISLKELLEEELENRDAEDDVIDIEEILAE